VTHDPLLPSRLLPPGYPGPTGVAASRENVAQASRQLRTFNAARELISCFPASFYRICNKSLFLLHQTIALSREA